MQPKFITLAIEQAAGNTTALVNVSDIVSIVPVHGTDEQLRVTLVRARMKQEITFYGTIEDIVSQMNTKE
jgi:hypothetical protein